MALTDPILERKKTNDSHILYKEKISSLPHLVTEKKSQDMEKVQDMANLFTTPTRKLTPVPNPSCSQLSRNVHGRDYKEPDKIENISTGKDPNGNHSISSPTKVLITNKLDRESQSSDAIFSSLPLHVQPYNNIGLEMDIFSNKADPNTRTVNFEPVIPHLSGSIRLDRNKQSIAKLKKNLGSRSFDASAQGLPINHNMRRASSEAKINAQLSRKGQPWLHIPSLFYLFANLIELHELLHKKREYEAEMLALRESGNPVASLLDANERGSMDDQVYQKSLSRLWDHISYSIFEVDGILLNPLLSEWSDNGLRNILRKLVKEWSKHGPESTDFEEASLVLLNAISDDRRGNVYFTMLYDVWFFIGTARNINIIRWIFLILGVLSCVGIMVLVTFPNLDFTLKVPVAVLLALFLISQLALALSLLHHNGYTDATANFFRDELLAFAKENISKDDDIDVGERCASIGSWPSRGERGLITSSPNPLLFANESDSPMFGAPTVPPRDPQGDPMEGFQTNTLTLQYDDTHRRATIENYGNDVRGLGVRDEQVIPSSMRRRSSIASPSQSHTGLVLQGLENVYFTALVYSLDVHLAETLLRKIWEYNFIVVKKNSLATLGDLYRMGSERYKILLVNAADLYQNLDDLSMALSWATQGRIIYFFSTASTGFPPQIPHPLRVEIPLNDADIANFVRRAAGLEGVYRAAQPEQQNMVETPSYTLGRRLGGGAFGNVFEAELEGTGLRCAVKRMYLKNNGFDGGEEESITQLREIIQEAEIMQSLKHPNIVQYYFCKRDGNCISIFMELCCGGSLSSLIATRSLRDPHQIKQILSEIIGAVVYLHNRRIVHRDLKPENVLFSDGKAKVTDFGAAGLKHEDLQNVKGTFAYMAPEVLLSEPHGKECDVWSIGCITAEVLSVCLPHRSLGLPELCEVYRKMPLDEALEIECDETEVCDFLFQCLQRNPKNRATAEALLKHNMLKISSSSIHHWVERLTPSQRTDTANGFTQNCSRIEFESVDDASLKSSAIFGEVERAESDTFSPIHSPKKRN